MNEIVVPFNGLFRTDTGHSARTFSGLRWDFPARDLNESARALFTHLDRLFGVLHRPGFVFLSTIELDAEAGRFPEVLLQYFRDEEWADTQSFFVGPIRRIGKGSLWTVGRVTFEASAGQTVRVLAQNGGFRWGAGLRVWGLQVPEDRVGETIEMSTDDGRQLAAVHEVARGAWLAGADLDVLALWLSSSVGEETRAQINRFASG
jgi:hypothetical protein